MESVPKPNANLESNEEIRGSEKLLSQEEADRLADETRKKIDFLNSVKERIFNEEELTAEEKSQKQHLFDGKEFDGSNPLWIYVSSLEQDHYQLATAGKSGAENVSIEYPVGVHHKGSSFEESLKEKEGTIKEIYHSVGTFLDRGMEEIVAGYNRTVSSENKLFFEENSPHATRWWSVSCFDDSNKKGLELNYGLTKYVLLQDNNGRWYALLESPDWSLQPKKVAGEERDLKRNIAKLLEEKANSLLR